MSRLLVEDYDVVLISSTYCAKNINLKNNKKVIHYCHSPSRFLHGLITETDHNSLPKWQRFLIVPIKKYLKKVDLKAVENLNKNNCIWIGNSKFIQKTIKEVYKIDSGFIYPPIDLEKFIHNIRKEPKPNEEFYFSFGRVSFHKRIDLAIQTCLKMNKKLIIAGSAGSQLEMDQLKNIVKEHEEKHPESKGLITFLGRVEPEELEVFIGSCKAFLFPGKEDFGMAPVEMLAAGIPVIAYKAGGALEYVEDEKNGLFFDYQTIDSLSEAIIKFEKLPKNYWDVNYIKNSAMKFGLDSFNKSFRDLIEK
jgi:glycosyltransferase involved in cell wall biosynthesis